MLAIFRDSQPKLGNVTNQETSKRPVLSREEAANAT